MISVALLWIENWLLDILSACGNNVFNKKNLKISFLVKNRGTSMVIMKRLDKIIVDIKYW
jgi:hypothetical protein